MNARSAASLLLAVLLAVPAGAVECDVTAGFPTPIRNQRDIGDCHANAALDLLEHALARSGHRVELSLADLFLMTTIAQPWFIASVMDAYLGKTPRQASFPEGAWGSNDAAYGIEHGVARLDRATQALAFDNYVAFRGRMIDAMETYVNPAVRRRLASLSSADQAALDGLVDGYYAKHSARFAGFLSGLKSLTGWKDKDVKILIRPFFYHELSRWIAYQMLAGKDTPAADAARVKELFGGVGNLAALDASREEVRPWMKGLKVVPAPKGARRPAWVADNLCRAKRPVAVALDLKGLKGWNVGRPASHEFLITGIRARDVHGHPYAFAVRNSWGSATANHDVTADDVTKAFELFTVSAPGDAVPAH